MGSLTINNMGLVHTILDCAERALYLGEHATINSAIRNKLLSLLNTESVSSSLSRFRGPAVLVSSDNFFASSSSIYDFTSRHFGCLMSHFEAFRTDKLSVLASHAHSGIQDDGD